MGDNDRHVVPHNGGWNVKAPHAERASSHHETQAEAIARAREIVANAGGGELVIHAVDGHIRESDTVAAATRATRQPAEQADVVDLTAPTRPPILVSTEPFASRGSSEPPDSAGGDDHRKLTLTSRVKRLLHRSPS